MLNILILIFLIICRINCINIYNENPDILEDISHKTFKIGFSQTFPIDYRTSLNTTLDIENDKTYQINIHSINCNIALEFYGEIINHINLNTYSIKMNEVNKSFTIRPLIDIIDGEEKENYDQEKCYVSINGFDEIQPEVKIEIKKILFSISNRMVQII